MARIAIVTDSTADLPFSFYEENDVTAVPLIVRFGEDVYKDWLEMPPKKFYGKMRASEVLPKTSQPSVQDFIEAYERHKDCDHILSIHLSAKLSGTHQSAHIASQNVSVPVTVIDTKQASVGTGIIVQELVKARSEGKNVNEMIGTANELAGRVRIAFYVDTLKYLEMGGRIGKAAALAGSILNIKPILTLEDGVVSPLKKVKGKKKAIKEIVDFVRQFSAGQKVKIALMHADAEESLIELENALLQADIDYQVILKSEIGSVIGTYVGPGAFAILLY